MASNIEQLKTEVDDITDSLKKLKENVSLSESEKKKQAESLKTKAEETKQKVEHEIQALETVTNDTAKKKKEEAEALLNSFNDIVTLYNSIINPSNNTSSTSTQPEQESKNIFGKAWDWTKEQWNAVWDKEKRGSEGGKNVLRTAGFLATGIGAVSLAYKGIKKLFGGMEDEIDKETDEESDKETDKDTSDEDKNSRRKRLLVFLIDRSEKKTKSSGS